MFYRAGTSDQQVIQQVFRSGDYDISSLQRFPEVQRLLVSKEQQGKRPLIVDGGANIGAASLYFSTTCPAAVVVAIEPEPSNYQVLLKNVAGLPVKCELAALASSPGKVKVIDVGNDNWGFRTEPADEDEDGVACTTVNEVYERECRGQVYPFITKIDIEGFESNLFEANTQWIDKTPIIAIELHDWAFPKAGTAKSFLKCIAGLDRDFVLMGENILSIRYDLDCS